MNGFHVALPPSEVQNHDRIEGDVHIVGTVQQADTLHMTLMNHILVLQSMESDKNEHGRFVY